MSRIEELNDANIRVVYNDAGDIEALIDNNGRALNIPLVSKDVTGGIGNLSVGGKVIGLKPRIAGKRPAFTRCVASNFASPVSSDNKCYAHAIAMPGKFDAVRIGFVHVGGSGAVVGMTAAVAATDDLGDRSNTNTAAGRRFATPYRAGVEKNEYSADGWSRMTVGGATSWGIADPGGNNIEIAWSDIIPVHGIEDSVYPGMYPLLVRVYGGTGVFTRTGQTGLADVTKWIADAGKNYVFGCERVAAGDAVGTLANWANLNNVGFNDADCIAMVIEAWSADSTRTVAVVGDSRFALSAPSLAASKSYKSASFYLEKALSESVRKIAVARCARGAQTNATFYQWATKYLGTLLPDAAVYLCYSINNGVPTKALLDVEKTRTLQFINANLNLGVMPILVPVFPYSTGFGAASADVAAFNEWVKSLGMPYVDVLALYGDANGGWRAGLAEDANHMTDATAAEFGGLVLRDAVLALI